MTHHNNRRLIEAFAIERDPSVLAEDIVFRDQAQERSFHGREAVAGVLNDFFIHGFTRAHTDVQTMVVDETEAALAFVFHGRQDGFFMGIPPTRQEVAVPMVMLCQLHDGQIRQAVLYYNAGTLLRQLGLG